MCLNDIVPSQEAKPRLSAFVLLLSSSTTFSQFHKFSRNSYKNCFGIAINDLRARQNFERDSLNWLVTKNVLRTSRARTLNRGTTVILGVQSFNFVSSSTYTPQIGFYVFRQLIVAFTNGHTEFLSSEGMRKKTIDPNLESVFFKDIQ